MTQDMQTLALQGMDLQNDPGCGVLFGTLYDTALKIRKLCEEEIEVHREAGLFTIDDEIALQKLENKTTFD